MIGYWLIWSNGCSNCFLLEHCRFSCWLEALSSSCGDLRVFVVLGVYLVTKCLPFFFRYWRFSWLILCCVHPSPLLGKKTKKTGRTRNPFSPELFPWNFLVTMAIGHNIGGVLSFFRTTMSPICKFCCSSVHFCRCCSIVSYSLDHRFQKKFMKCCHCWNLWTSDKSAESGGSISRTASNERPIIRWAGVRAGKNGIVGWSYKRTRIHYSFDLVQQHCQFVEG